MTTTPIKLSDTARALLTLASTRNDRLVRPPELPAAAARQVVRSLLGNGLVTEVTAPIEDADYAWRTDEGGTVLMLQATDTGFAAINASVPEQQRNLEAFTRDVVAALAEEGCNETILEEEEVRIMVGDGFANGRSAIRVARDMIDWLAETEAEAEEAMEAASTSTQDAHTADDDAVAREAAAVAEALDTAPTTPACATLRHAAQAVLDAWNDEANRETDIIAALEGPMAGLRAALGERATRPAATTVRKPREGTKQEQVVALLRRTEGATIDQIKDATTWQSHTVRGFLAGLKKKGIEVTILDRVRQVGPDKQGAKGSYSIYHIATTVEG